MVPGHGGARACARWPRWSPSSATSRCPRRRRWRRCRAAGCCRGAATSGWRRSTSPTCAGMEDARYAVEVAAAGGHHLLLSGPKGSGKTSIAERIPGHPPRPDPRGVARAHGGALAGRGARARRRAADPAAVRRAPPRRQQGQPGGRRLRARSGPARSAAPTAACCSSTSSRSSAPTSSTRCASRSRAATSASPAAEESVVLPARAMVVLAANPCPCGDFHPTRGLEPVQLPRGAAPRLPAQGHRADHRPDRHHPPPRRSHADGQAATRSRSASPPPTVRARVEAARARQAERYADEQLAAQRPRARPGARGPLAADPRGAPSWSTTSSGTGG